MADAARKMPSRSARHLGAPFAALLIEAAAMMAVIFYKAPIGSALAVHGIVVAGLVWRVVGAVRSGGDAGTAVLQAVAVAIAGPFGAIGGLVIDWLSVQGQEHRDRLQRWYQRISLSTDVDDLTRLSDQVVIGRSMNLRAAPPPSFTRLLEHGSVGEKQAVLGLVARRFHPHYLSALRTALVSEEPVIRVQAAAVAARVRGELGSEVERLIGVLDGKPGAAEMLRVSDEIVQSVDSGLIEERLGERARRAAAEARDVALTQLAAAARPALSGRSTAPDSSLNQHAARLALEDRLLATQRYEDFRRLRRAFAFPVKGRMRFRVGQWPQRRMRKLSIVTGGSTAR